MERVQEQEVQDQKEKDREQKKEIVNCERRVAIANRKVYASQNE